MHFFTRFRTYFNPRTPEFIKARQQNAGIKEQQEIISCFPYFTRMLIFCQIGAWMLKLWARMERQKLNGLTRRHGCAGLVQPLRISNEGWCSWRAARRAAPTVRQWSRRSRPSNALYCTHKCGHFLRVAPAHKIGQATI